MKKSEDKTNVMRILDGGHVPYVSHIYVDTGAVSGLDVSEALGEDPRQVFKTLVTVGNSKKITFFWFLFIRSWILKRRQERSMRRTS